MNNTLEKSEIKKAAIEAVTEYLKLKTINQEHEDDISFWSVNKKIDTEQETDNDNNMAGTT